MLALAFVAVSLGLSNLAAAIGIGASGVDGPTRLRVGVAFGVFEAGMPVLGLALGHGLASRLGGVAHWIGSGLLIATGIYGVLQALRGDAGTAVDSAGPRQWGRLLITGLALSIDNVVVGFALGTYRVGFAVAAITIGVVSVAMSLIGLELGGRLAVAVGRWGELCGGVVLIGVGVAVGANVL